MAFDNERSSLWGLAAGTAAVGGTGYGFWKNRSHFSQAWNAGNGPSMNSLSSFAANIPGFRTGSAAVNSGSANEVMQAMASRFESKSGLNTAITDIHGAAYRSIMSGGITSHAEAVESLKFIGQQKSGAEAYSAAMSAIGTSGGSANVFESSLASFASDSSRSAMSGVSGGGFGSTFASNTTFANLPGAAQKRALEIQQNIGVAAGDKFNVKWDYRTITDKINNKEINTPMLIGRIGEDRIASIPLIDRGITYGGDDFSSRYITRKGYMPGGTQLSYPELYERNIIEALAGDGNNAKVKQNVLNAHRDLIQQMNIRDSKHRAAAVWTGPFMTSGGSAKARLTGIEAVPFGSSDPLDMISKGGLQPWVSSGSSGGGVLSTRNLATDLFGDLGNLMSAEEIPTQFVRGQWGVTAEAKGRVREFRGTFGQNYNRLGRKGATTGYKELIYGGKSALSPQAYSAPQLMTFYAKPASGIGGLGYADPQLNKMLSAEEGVISSGVTNMMEYERIVQKKIALDKGMRANEGLLGKLAGKTVGSGPITLEGEIASGFMGIERGTGAEISGEIVGAELTGKDAATVYMRERKTMSEKEMWKFFSEENKFTAAATNQAKMNRVLDAAGARPVIAGQEVEAMFSGKLVAKRKMALITQQTEAASMFLSHKIDQGSMKMTPEVAAFLSDPAAALNVSGIMASNKVNADIEIQKNLMGMAKSWKFSKEELGLTFGLAPEAALESGVLTARQRMAVRQSTGVIGLGKGRLGDIMSEGGAGNWGSFEQTGFRVLGSKGEVGQRYAVEMAKRISGSGELMAADTMMSTVLGQEGMIDKFKRGPLTNITDISPDDLFQAEGRYVGLGQSVKGMGGSKALYIPGTAEAPGMMNDIVAGGKRVRSPVAQGILGLRSALKRGSGFEDQIEIAAESLRNVAVQVSEAQATARGKIIGSSMLAGQRRTFATDVDAFRISGETGESMFSDLISRAETKAQSDFLREQRRLFRQGEVMTGGMWRHPTTGPESFQWAKFKKDKTIANGMVAAPTQFGKLQFQGKEIPVDVSAMVGFKGDFDNDKFVLSLISDKRTADMARRAADNEGREAYAKYLFNHYTIKDRIEGKLSKSSILEFGSEDALREGYRKLSTAKTTTGEVNIALQKLKIGMMASGNKESAPIAEMFFHLEEAAIGGKHGVLSSGLYKSIAEATKTGGEQGIGQLEQVIKSVMGEESQTITGSITDALGNVTTHTQNYDPRKWSEAAMSGYNAVGADVDVAMRAAAAAKGRNIGDISLNKATEMMYARQTGSVDFAQSVMQAAANKGSESFMTKGTRMLRKGQIKSKGLMSALGRSKKPILAGLGIAAGVMLMAPSTAGTLRNPEGANGGRGMMPDNYGAPSSSGMRPPPPRMNASPRVYDIGGGSKTSHANIRMRVNDLNSSSRDFMSSARQLSDGGHVNIRTRDDRSTLDPRMLANKIHERL